MEHAEEVYGALRGLAAAYLHQEREDHTLQPTALVHEAFVKLASGKGGAAWNDRAHFQALASNAMRQILVDHARRRASQKRGGGWIRVSLSEAGEAAAPEDVDLLALDEALRELEKHDARKVSVVELRFFGGLTGAQAARHLGIAERTAEADWYFARAWLRSRLAEHES
jgi:RNA polymerase sigma factor (TIGR02999 family)